MGFALRPSDTWLLAIQADRTGYEVLGRPRGASLIFGVNQSADGTPFGTEFIKFGWTPRLGVEKSFPLSGDGAMGLSVFSLRAGAYRVPDHDGLPQINSRETHTSFGFGAAFANGLQLDLAADLSDTLDTVMLSTVYRF